MNPKASFKIQVFVRLITSSTRREQNHNAEIDGVPTGLPPKTCHITVVDESVVKPKAIPGFQL
jgi:hypothetical protein